MEVFFLLQNAADAYHDGQARGLPIGVAYAPDDLFDDEHCAPGTSSSTVEHDDVPPAKYPGAPMRFSAYDRSHARAPRLGEHTDGGARHGCGGPDSSTRGGSGS